jgi:FixJ family two-component response regulator
MMINAQISPAGHELIPHQGVVCLIGEDPAVRDSLAALLQAHGYGVIAEARHDRPSILPMIGVFCVVLDPHREGYGEAEVIAQTRAAFPDLPMIAISHGLERPLPPSARVESMLEKPLSPQRLLDAVGRLRRCRGAP